MTPGYKVGDTVWVETAQQWGTVERSYEDGAVVSLPAPTPDPIPWHKAVPETASLWLQCHCLWAWMAIELHQWQVWLFSGFSFLCFLLDINTAFVRRRKSVQPFPYVQPTSLTYDERMQRMASIRHQLDQKPDEDAPQ